MEGPLVVVRVLNSNIIYISESRRSGFTQPTVKTQNQAVINENITQHVYEHFKKQLRLTDEWIKNKN